MELLPEECQWLSEEESREERDREVLGGLLEVLWLLVVRGGGKGDGDGKDGGRGLTEGARLVKERGGYVVVREVHLRWEDEGVRRWCERIVDVLMGGEGVAEGGKGGGAGTGGGGAGKNIRGSGLLQTEKRRDWDGGDEGKGGKGVGGGEKGAKVGKVVEEDEDDEDNAIVPIF